MEKIPIGEFIREHRKAQGLSQEALCAGVCERETLSRIERGARFPSNQVLHMLLEKLGLPDRYYVVPPTEYELNIQALRRAARAKVIAFQNAAPADKPSHREEAVEAIRELEDYTANDDLLTHQRILNERISLGTPEGPYSQVQRRELMLKALKLTAPLFDPQHIDGFRYTQEETVLINQIANTYLLEENYAEAISIYRQLLCYLRQNNVQLSRYPAQITMITFNYALALMLNGQYSEAIDTAEIGRKACVQYGEHEFQPQLLAILAACHAHLGNRKVSEEFFRQAFYLYKAFEDWVNLNHLETDAMDLLGLTLP